MKSKTRGDGRMVKPTRRDLTMGDNPWNGTREIANWSQTSIGLRAFTYNFTR